jgi:hypothetical protein
VSKLPQWQQDDILRKQKTIHDNQEALQRQIDERNRYKALQEQQEKEREMREQARIEREQKELSDRYSRDTSGGALPTQLKKDAEKTQSSEPPVSKQEAMAKAREEAAEKLLQAQAEAEELKRNKFKSKRVHDQPDERRDSVAPKRTTSPPLPGQRRNTNATMIDETLPVHKVKTGENNDPPMYRRDSRQPQQQEYDGSREVPLSTSSTVTSDRANVEQKTRAVLDQLADIKKVPVMQCADDRNWSRKNSKCKVKCCNVNSSSNPCTTKVNCLFKLLLF